MTATGMTNRIIPMSRPDITAAEIDAVNEVLRTPFLSIGPRIEAFEREMAAYLGARHAIAVSSGTAGLHLAVIAAGVRDGDEVITTPFSFVASANVILYERARPVFVDIDPESMNLDPERVARAITPRTKAILAVHAFGQPADMDAIGDVARWHGLPVLEDACEALGAEYNGRRAGTLGSAGVFGFYPNKQMTTGEGGLIATDDDEWDRLFRSLRNQGRDRFDAWLEHARLGYNYRLDELSAALGLAQLRRIEELLVRRERVAQWYAEALEGLPELTVPRPLPSTTRQSWFVYVIRVAPPVSRDRLMTLLEARGVPSRRYFTPVHLQPFFRARFGYQPGEFPITEAIANATLALPFFGAMTLDDVGRVAEALRDALRQIAA